MKNPIGRRELLGAGVGLCASLGATEAHTTRGSAFSQILLLVFSATLTAADVRLSNDVGGGYISAYTLATGTPYTDAVLNECSIARGRQNEPSVAVDPRNTLVLIGSSNDYCGVYAGTSAPNFSGIGPVWLGYYRSENGGYSFRSSLVPGYPGDQSPFATLARIRTASSGDPVVAWDGHGRVFLGSESSDDPAGTKKTFGDVWVARFENPEGETGATLNDGKLYTGTSLVATGSSAPNLLGKFHDKTAIEADRTGGACDSNVYFAWSRFTGVGNSNIYFSRSTDHGTTWSTPKLLTQNIANVQDPDISVTGSGAVYVTFDMGATNSGQTDSVGIAKSTDCGRTFAKPRVAVEYTSYEARDRSAQQPPPASVPDDPESEEEAVGSSASDCGDFQNTCQSGYTFFRHGTSTRSTADQKDSAHEWIYIVFGASKPGTQVQSGTTFGSIRSGTGSQSGAYFLKYDGATGTASTPTLIDAQAIGHQIFPDISADGGALHTIWWDSRSDPSYSPARPVGNDAAGVTGAALDVYGAASNDGGVTWTASTKVNTVRSNPNYEQFSDRTVPFGGDYLWVTSIGSFAYSAWTDWRNTVTGSDPRESTAADGADVKQCRTLNSATGVWSNDQCPHDGGIDQDIYGAALP